MNNIIKCLSLTTNRISNIIKSFYDLGNFNLINYTKKNFGSPEKMNIVIDIVRHSFKEIYEDIILLFLSLTQDVNLFSKVWWRGNGTSGTGNVILADIEAADWKNILFIVEKSDVGIKLIPIKKYLNTQIESCLRSGDWERQRRFLEQD